MEGSKNGCQDEMGKDGVGWESGCVENASENY